MYARKVQLVLLSLSCLQSLPLQADNIRVVTEYRSYYQLKNSDDSLGGYATEVVQALFAITGDTAQFEVNSWARSYYEAVNNDNVLIYSMAYNPERAALFDCVAELDNEKLFFWALKGRISQPLLTLNDLLPYHIAVSISSNPDQYLTAQGMKRLLRTATPEHALSMLFKQRVDLVIGAEKSVYRRSQQLGYDAGQLEKVFQIAGLNHPLCAAFNLRSDPALRQRYHRAFATLQQNGTLAQIKQRWQLDE
ncbi:substrate-binding periplasmic protein [Rheinheimera sp. NSM]|uniref:substrate-binding periplasmic protein n=1 Tax=Rheinheimera sp. NSM TaxID=3457884 RepID=UPI0040350021